MPREHTRSTAARTTALPSKPSEPERVFIHARMQQAQDEFGAGAAVSAGPGIHENQIRVNVSSGISNTRVIVREDTHSNSATHIKGRAVLCEFMGENVKANGTRSDIAIIPIKPSKKSKENQQNITIPLQEIVLTTSARLHQQTKYDNDAAMLSIIASCTIKNKRTLCTANIGSNRVMVAFLTQYLQWSVMRIVPQHHYEFNNDETLRQLYNSNQNFGHQSATRCLGDAKNFQHGISHCADVIEEIPIPDHLSLFVFVMNEDTAVHMNEEVLQAVLKDQGTVERGAEHRYAKKAVESISRIQFETNSGMETGFDVDKRSRSLQISCLVIDDLMPNNSVVLHHVATAKNGKATAKKIDNQCVKIFKETMAQSAYLNRQNLPRVNDALRMKKFYSVMNSAVEGIELASIGYYQAMEKEKSGILNLSRFLPKKGPCATQKQLESILEETNKLMSILNDYLVNPSADSAKKIHDSLHDFQRKLLTKKLPEKILNIGIQLFKILFFTALSLLSLAMVPSVFGMALPSFHFYALFFTGKAVMTSLPAILTLGVGGGTCLYRTKNAFFPKAHEREMKHALVELSAVGKSAVGDLGLT